MKAAAILKNKIASEKPVLGLLATFHLWPGMVEIAINAGLDYILIDSEHLTHDAAMVAEACAIGRRADFAVLLRPPSAEFTPVRLAMDLGPCGLLIPYVETAATLDEVQQAVYMKPRGRRRPGGLGNFWLKDYNYETWKREIEDDLIILPQIESKIGLENADAIARHPLTTYMAVGPFDLATDLGICWQPENPLLHSSIERVRAAGKAAGKNMWMIGSPPDLIRRGFNFICVAEAAMLLQSTLKKTVSEAATQP